MKHFKKGIAIAIFFLAASGSEVFGSSIIDYASLAEFNTLTPSQIQDASALKIMFRHASVGSNINGGLDVLAAVNPLLNRANFSFQPRGNPGWQAKIQDLIDQTQLQLANFSIFSMKFCYIDSSADVIVYIQAMENLEATYPSKKFVWWTMPTTTSGDNQAYNNSLRAYTTAHNKVLFDVASIESHHADGTACTNAGKECLCAEYTSDGGHLNSVGAQRVAKAFWVMMARLAAPPAPKMWYVSPAGIASNTGAIDSPWDLQTALQDNTIAANKNSQVKPGDTIFLRGGTYQGSFASYLKGSDSGQITVRSQTSEWAIINGALLHQTGGYTTYMNFEITNAYTPNAKRVTSMTGSAPTDLTMGGFNGYAPRLKVINLIIHDAVGSGMGLWSSAPDSEAYGNIVFHNGWDAPDRGHGHGIYMQNDKGNKLIGDNIFYGNLGGYGIHAYTEGGALHNMSFEGNIVFGNQFLVGGYTPAFGISLFGNIIGENGSLSLGYSSTPVNVDASVVKNYFWGSPQPGLSGFSCRYWNKLDFSDNFVRGSFDIVLPTSATDYSLYHVDNNKYYLGGLSFKDGLGTVRANNFSTWQNAGFDKNGTYSAALPSAPITIVRPNRYDSTRANVIILNVARDSNVPVDLSIFLASGDTFEVRDAQNYLAGPVFVGTFTGGTVLFPMILNAVPQYAGDFTGAYHSVQAVHTSSDFGVFVLRKTDRLSIIYGDVSGDGKVSAYDAALAAQYAVGLITCTPEQVQRADVTGDRQVSAYDAALIAQHAVGLITNFPVQG